MRTFKSSPSIISPNVCLLFHLLTYQIFLLVSSSQTSSSSTANNFQVRDKNLSQIRRCCHPNYELLHDRTGNNYFCGKLTQNEAKIDFFNLESEEIYGIPDCGKNFEANFKCLDVLKGRPVEVFCAESRNNGKIFGVISHRTYRTMRKCCPFDKIYDSKEKICVSSNISKEIISENLSRIGSNFISNSSFNLCPINEVVLEKSHPINITKFDYSTDFCLDLASDDEGNLHWITHSCHSPKICYFVPCVRKCCKFGDMIIRANGSSICVPFQGSIKTDFHSVENWLATEQAIQKVDVNVHGILQTQSCHRYPLDPDFPEDAHYFEHTSGNLYLNSTETPFKNDNYCREMVNSTLMTFVCALEPPSINYFYVVGFVLSAIGFAMTIVVYLCFKQLHGNLHGKIVMCYNACFLIAYLILLTTTFIYSHSDTFSLRCRIFGYTLYFTFICGFVWSNILCFDIWLTIVKGATRNSKRFCFYFIYAKIVSGTLVTILYAARNTNLLPYKWRPTFAEDKCWFDPVRDSTSFVLYFITPLGIMIAINSIFFVLTAIHCNKVKREIMRVQKSSIREKRRRLFKVDRAIVAMNLKLFTVMGVSWILEVISALDYKKHYFVLWHLTDAFNAFLGVFVFLVFICKGRVFKLIKKRLGIQEEVGPMTRTTSASSRKFNTIDSKKGIAAVMALQPLEK
ncbi:probable G-protein coupled receptor Mth-like 3 [Culicoides brevitarsis]|uniref:probable G-protein coupled receptor Mth-like 3 n=1 Tax=Culicoides brevitarsis TaxID=469753 RepID=UPI00307B301C